MTQHLSTDTIIDYLHGELSPAEDALAHAHVQACSTCRAEFERESALSDALRAAVRGAERELPSMVKARIWEAVRNQPASPLQRLTGFLRPAIAVPAAAILVVAAYFASPLARPPANARTVDVMYYFEQHAAEQMQTPLGERNASSAILETSDAGPPETPSQLRSAAAALDVVE